MRKNLQPIGMLLVALAFMAFGIDHFVFQTFVTGRPPVWPQGLPGEHLVAYFSGVLFFTSGMAILTRKGWQFVFAAGVLILIWCASRNLYQLIVSLDYGGLLTSTNKALSIGGCGLATAALLSKRSELAKAMTVEKYLIGIFLFTAGIQHFIFADFVKYLVPVWIPFPMFWTYFAGVALIAAGFALIIGVKAELAATISGSMVFSWVLLLHIPRALSFNNANEWTAVAEATLVSGMLLLIAAHLRKE